jgi:hypothetical protein
MSLSIFFAQLLGLYFLILAVFMLFRKKYVEEIAGDFFATRGLLYFAGAINLLIGLIIVIVHNIWVWDWRVVITLLGYLFILKGVVRMAFPETSRAIEPKMLRGYWIIFVIVAIIGIYLTYKGFTADQNNSIALIIRESAQLKHSGK